MIPSSEWVIQLAVGPRADERGRAPTSAAASRVICRGRAIRGQ